MALVIRSILLDVLWWSVEVLEAESRIMLALLVLAHWAVLLGRIFAIAEREVLVLLAIRLLALGRPWWLLIVSVIKESIVLVVSARACLEYSPIHLVRRLTA